MTSFMVIMIKVINLLFAPSALCDTARPCRYGGEAEKTGLVRVTRDSTLWVPHCYKSFLIPGEEG